MKIDSFLEFVISREEVQWLLLRSVERAEDHIMLGTAKGVQVTSHRVFKRGFAKFHNRSEALPLKILYPVSLWTTESVRTDKMQRFYECSFGTSW
jgi:hypothetical protein